MANNVQTNLSLDDIVAAYAAGLRIVTCIPAKGAKAGKLCFAVSDNGTSAQNRVLVPVSKPAPVTKPARKRVTKPAPVSEIGPEDCDHCGKTVGGHYLYHHEPTGLAVCAACDAAYVPEVIVATQTADAAPVRYVTLADKHGDGGAAGDVEVEVLSSPTPPTPPAAPADKRIPAVNKGEHNLAYYGRCVLAGFTRKQAGQAYREQRDARKAAQADTKAAAESAAFVAEMTAKTAPVARKARATKRPSQAPAARTDVDAVTETRKARKARMDADVTSMQANVDANSKGIAANAEMLATVIALLS